jgi:hypothetical protein
MALSGEEGLLEAQRSFHRLKQSYLAKGLQQALDGSIANIWPDGEICVGGDENCRDVMALPHQFSAQFWP